MIGTNELLVILGILVVLFGARKVPEFARSLGKAQGEFQKALKESELELMEYERKFKQAMDSKTKLEKLAIELGIDPRGKSETQLIEDIRKELNRKEVAEP